MFMGQDGFIWWIGVVEDNNDPLLIGRARVRIFGYHPKAQRNDAYSDTANNLLATADLPWAVPILPLNMSNAYGKINLGEWVFGFFLDGEAAQEPVILGYMPSANRQDEYYFSKHPTPRSFYDLQGSIPEGVYSGADFANKSNRFEWHTPSNHHIRMTEIANQYGNKDFVLAHSTPGMYVQMTTDSGGQSNAQLRHPLGTGIEFTSDGRCIIRTKWPYEIENVRLDPPPPRRRRRGCFTDDTIVTMANGSKKKIVDVRIGEYVMSKGRKTSNRVKFIEIVDGKYFNDLYSPNYSAKPFATLDHPLFLYGELASVDPKTTQSMYPWLGKCRKISIPVIDINTKDKVYNLWVDGDGTYIVNNFATTSIIYDGGMLTKLYEKALLSKEKVLELYSEYTLDNKNYLLGAFILNYIIGKMNLNILYKFIAYCGDKHFNHPVRKYLINIPMLVVGKLFKYTSWLHKWRFFR